MLQEASDLDGRLVHSRGLKYVLADLYGFQLRGPRRRLEPGPRKNAKMHRRRTCATLLGPRERREEQRQLRADSLILM